MQRFITGFFPFEHELQPAEVIKARGWWVTFENIPDWTERSHHAGKTLFAVIHTSTLVTASNAFNLIGAALTARHGGLVGGTDLFPYPEAETARHEIVQKYGVMAYTESTLHCGAIPESIRIAARASHSIDAQYALLKYRMGCATYSLPPVETDPHLATEHWGVIPFRESHVILASAIITYYSVVEQLGLEVKASKEKPSRLPNGEWNPPVFEDLTRRLTTSGILVREPIVWIQRGTPTKVGTTALKTAKSTKTPWTRGPYVRDKFIDVRDAILAASNLRSKVSSHRLDHKVASLTPYDVENVRNLARRLLLTRLGCPVYEVFDSSE
ncbi:MAG: hypothetical protein ACEB74_02015 [Desulfovibrio aminophilus]|uniref:hypothetical protein n=1 Tax=Desulfovibrio aminophilus TaxID=81425 RepID=UPI0039E8D8E9